jgi:hypothetical protein
MFKKIYSKMGKFFAILILFISIVSVTFSLVKDISVEAKIRCPENSSYDKSAYGPGYIYEGCICNTNCKVNIETDYLCQQRRYPCNVVESLGVEIEKENIVYSYCDNQTIKLGDRFNCAMNLIQSGNGIYFVPGSDNPLQNQDSLVAYLGITDDSSLGANTAYTTVSSPCTINLAVLTCPNIPTLGVPNSGKYNIVIKNNYGSLKHFTVGEITIIDEPQTLFEIKTSDINYHSCRPTDLKNTGYIVNLGEKIDCIFELYYKQYSSSFKNWEYVLPTNGIQVQIKNSAFSSECEINNNLKPRIFLDCRNIPTLGGDDGFLNFKLSIDNMYRSYGLLIRDPNPKDTVISSEYIDRTNFSCLESSVYIGQKLNCKFKLIGAEKNRYAMPSSSIFAFVTSSQTQYNSSCLIINNYTNPELECKEISTYGAKAGLQAVKLNIVENQIYSIVEIKEIPLPPQPVKITAKNIDSENSKCDNQNLTIGETTTCYFRLKGSENNIYTHGTDVINASISSSTAYSWGCSLILNGSGLAALKCTNVPSDNGNAGSQIIKTNLDGDQTTIPISLKNKEIQPTVIKADNIDSRSSKCEKSKMSNNDNMTCYFKLKGSQNYTYVNSSYTINAYISSASGYSWGCDIIDNFTSDATLRCLNLPSAGASDGTQFIKTNLRNDMTNIRVQIYSEISNIIPAEITSSNIDMNNTYCSNPKIILGNNTTCYYKLKGSMNNTYTNQYQTINASISTASGYSWGCDIMDNYTVNATLRCLNVPTENSTLGMQNLKLNLNGFTNNYQVEIFNENF